MNDKPNAPLPDVERDEDMDRTYYPLPGGWEIQTRGKGSTFRIAYTSTDQTCDLKAGRWAITDEHVHAPLEKMAMDIRKALLHDDELVFVNAKDLRALLSALISNEGYLVRELQVCYRLGLQEAAPNDGEHNPIGHLLAEFNAYAARCLLANTPKEPT